MHPNIIDSIALSLYNAFITLLAMLYLRNKYQLSPVFPLEYDSDNQVWYNETQFPKHPKT